MFHQVDELGQAVLSGSDKTLNQRGMAQSLASPMAVASIGTVRLRQRNTGRRSAESVRSARARHHQAHGPSAAVAVIGTA